MEIQVLSAKRKLSKSLVKQMPSGISMYLIGLALKDRAVLGYVTDCHKVAFKLAIIKVREEYYTVPMHNWAACTDKLMTTHSVMDSKKRKKWKPRIWPKTPWILWGFRDKDRPWNRGKSKWVVHGKYKTEELANESAVKIMQEPWIGLYQNTKVTYDG